MKKIKWMLFGLLMTIAIFAFAACNPNSPQEAGIEVTPPAKTAYFVGDELDLTGMTVKLVYDDGSEEALAAEDYALTGFSSAEAGEVSVTVTYGDWNTTFKVTVSEPQAVGIEVTPPAKTAYFVGDELDLTGMTAKLVYNDGSKVPLDSEDLVLTGFSSAEEGEVSVTVTYGDWNTTFKVTVSEPQAVGIEVTPPAKVSYIIGDELDPTGMTAQLIYNNGSKEPIASEALALTGFSSTEAGEVTVTVSYLGFSDDFTVYISTVRTTGFEITPPTKVQYYIGDEFDPTGMTATLFYENKTEEDVALADLSFDGFRSDEVGEVTVTVSYRGYEDSFTVTVSLPPIDVSNVVFADKSEEYNGTEFELTADGIPNGIQVKYSDNKLTDAGETLASALLTSTDGAMLVLDGTEYEQVVLKATLTVTPKPVTAAVTVTLYATGEILTVPFVFTGIVAGEDPTYTVVTDPETVQAAGAYTATITFANGNYALSEPVSFTVLEKTVLASPTVRYNDGTLLIAPHDNTSTFAFSYDGVTFEAAGAEGTIEVPDLVGTRTVFVKAMPESVEFAESIPTEYTYYREGTLIRYDFSSAENGIVKDLSGNGIDLSLRNGYTVEESGVKLDNAKRDTFGIAQSPQWMASRSYTIELIARIDRLNTTQNSDYADNALLFKTGEYYIGFWSDRANEARLLMWLGSKSNPDLYYDDFSLWLPISNIVDGNFHQFAIQYDAVTGKVAYYMDYICLNTVTREPSDCTFTGNELLLGAWGNGADAANGTAVHYADATYSYLEIKNYAANLTAHYDKTGTVLASSETPLDCSSGAVQYLTQADDRPQFGSMSLSVTFSIVDDAAISSGRYTLAFRDWGIHLYILKDNGKWYGQCLLYTSATNTWTAAPGLDFGDISFIADGEQHTICVSFDGLTGKAYGRIDEIHYDWMEKDFGGSLLNPLWNENATPLYIGGASWGESLPAGAATVDAFKFSTDPTEVIL